MTKLIAITLAAFALSACSSMGSGPMGNTQPNSGATKNSTDSNRSGNAAAVSPGGAGAGAGAGAAGAAR